MRTGVGVWLCRWVRTGKKNDQRKELGVKKSKELGVKKSKITIIKIKWEKLVQSI